MLLHIRKKTQWTKRVKPHKRHRLCFLSCFDVAFEVEKNISVVIYVSS